MRILISNDDGYFSPGIEALAEVAGAFGDVTVIAPERDRSGASNSLTLDRPLSVRVAANGFLYLNGTPTDCVHIAVTGLLDHKPDLVLSGINDGANMGDDTIYSGTVAAAMEGYLLGVPSIAFSLARRGHEHLATAAGVARQLLQRFVRQPLTGPMLLNVNVPSCAPEALRGVQVTRLGRRHVAEPVVRATSPRGDTIYWIGPAGAAKEAGPGTDFHAVDNGWASITPLDIDLTAGNSLTAIGGWLESP
ncbi:MAG TPA: 5'/3'-nucleotidase SurE [Burkholderiaceae bacterium]|nr:5'/3'-nucleotidase SurE [Burkholderiaceae bacterium]HRA79046.1 5'/3'-nucleotidase SurE [Burkholderiaceae bacterium]